MKDEQSKIELNQNLNYRHYMQGMDSNHNTFYIDSVKDELNDKIEAKKEEKTMKRVQSLN